MLCTRTNNLILILLHSMALYMEADLLTDTTVIVRSLVFFSSHTHCHSNFLIKSDGILHIVFKPLPSQCGGLNRPLSSSLETDNDRVKWHNQTLMYGKVVSFQRFPHIEQNFIIMTLLHDHIFMGCGLNSTRMFWRVAPKSLALAEGCWGLVIHANNLYF